MNIYDLFKKSETTREDKREIKKGDTTTTINKKVTTTVYNEIPQDLIKRYIEQLNNINKEGK